MLRLQLCSSIRLALLIFWLQFNSDFSRLDDALKTKDTNNINRKLTATKITWTILLTGLKKQLEPKTNA